MKNAKIAEISMLLELTPCHITCCFREAKRTALNKNEATFSRSLAICATLSNRREQLRLLLFWNGIYVAQTVTVAFNPLLGHLMHYTVNKIAASNQEWFYYIFMWYQRFQPVNSQILGFEVVQFPSLIKSWSAVNANVDLKRTLIWSVRWFEIYDDLDCFVHLLNDMFYR